MGVGMTVETRDRLMMTRCIELSKASSKAGEYPYAAVICRNDAIVAESINKVTHDGDVTRHAELVAISQAQKALGTVSLDDCEIYVNAEPCAFCSYAIRESRIRRVVYALSSPHMGGVSKWNVLGDTGLSRAIPEVFAPPPEIVSGYMAKEGRAGPGRLQLTDRRVYQTSRPLWRSATGDHRVQTRAANQPTQSHPSIPAQQLR